MSLHGVVTFLMQHCTTASAIQREMMFAPRTIGLNQSPFLNHVGVLPTVASSNEEMGTLLGMYRTSSKVMFSPNVRLKGNLRSDEINT